MREIRFRAWDRKENRFVQGFDFAVASDGTPLQCGDRGWEKAEDYEIQQYTGLKDKNGREIYEGDVCRWNINIQEMVFEYGCFGLVLRRYDGSIKYLYPCQSHGSDYGFLEIEVEVIGNIYENPELLAPEPGGRE